MGLRRALVRPQERAITSVPWPSGWAKGYDLSDAIGNGGTWAGQRVDLDSAQQLLAVYGCVSFITSHLSTLPLDAYVRLSDGTSRPRPNPEWLGDQAVTDRTILLGQLLYSYLLDGNAFAVVVRGDTGRVTDLVPVHPHAIDIGYAAGRVYATINGSPFSGELLHIPHMVPPGQVRGVNPIAAARQSIGMGLAALQYGAQFFGQGSTLSGVLSFPGPMPEREDLLAIRENWVKVHGGAARSHLPGVLFGGATWTPISVNPDDAQFLETRRYTAAEIAGQLFLLPPTVLGIAAESGGAITYQNLETEWASTLRRMQPLMVKFERHLSALLPRPQFLRFKYDAYLRASTKERYETHAIAISSGMATVNERRALEDLPPLPGGDVLAGAATARDVAELIQKIYLGVGVVLTADEAREIANRAGAELTGSLPPAP